MLTPVRYSGFFRVVVLAFFFAVTGAALVRAASTKRIPFVPEILVKASYGMMSVFSTTSEHNWEIVAEGITEQGARERVLMENYYPMRRGFINEYIFNLWYRGNGSVNYQMLAQKLLSKERQRGRPYVSVELTQVTWPRSPAGYYATMSGTGVKMLLLATAMIPALDQ